MCMFRYKSNCCKSPFTKNKEKEHFKDHVLQRKKKKKRAHVLMMSWPGKLSILVLKVEALKGAHRCNIKTLPISFFEV